MEFPLLSFLTLFSLAVVASHAAISSEVYWKSKLPNTPIPKAIADILHSTGWAEIKSTSISVQKDGVNINTGKSKPGTKVNVGKGGVSVNTGKPGKHSNVGVGKGGVSRSTRPYVKYPKVFIYKYGSTETQLKDDPNVALFFLEKDMTPGTMMNLQFTKTTCAATFLPRQIADAIPFSLEKVPEILERFSVEPNSVEAEMIKKTINQCEDTGNVGEEKYCATSLESMIDFSTSKLGKKVKAISTEVNKEETKLQRYSIVGSKKLFGDEAVVCHKQNYTYAVFYCHKTVSTEAYKVSLVGDDGAKVKAVAVCHTDTSGWNPKYVALQVLKVKRGTVPVCHFLPEDHVVWVPYY